MLWFKHYCDANEGETINKIYAKMGHSGIGLFWLFLEAIAGKWDGNDSGTVRMPRVILQQKMKLGKNFLPKLNLLIDNADLSISFLGDILEIKYPKLSEIKSKNYAVFPDKCPSDAPKVPLDKNRIEKKRKEKKRKEEHKEKLDFDLIYKEYPRKEGKTAGHKIFQRTIKTQEQYNELILSVKNYAEKIRLENTEKKFIKMFSTFMDCWEDYVSIEIVQKETLYELLKKDGKLRYQDLIKEDLELWNKSETKPFKLEDR